MQAVDFPRDSGRDVCRAVYPQHQLTTGETCGEAGLTSEFLDYAGIRTSTVECWDNHGIMGARTWTISAWSFLLQVTMEQRKQQWLV